MPAPTLAVSRHERNPDTSASAIATSGLLARRVIRHRRAADPRSGLDAARRRATASAPGARADEEFDRCAHRRPGSDDPAGRLPPAGLPRRARRADLRASPPTATRVRARVAFRRNPARASDGPADLRLDGRSLKLVSAAIDGAAGAAERARPRRRGPDRRRRRTCPTPSPGRPRPRSRPRPTPRSKASTCRAACTAPSARPRASARSPTGPTAPT